MSILIVKNVISSTKTDIIIFSDFRHGIFNKSTIPILTSSINKNVFKVADSQVATRWGNITDFKSPFLTKFIGLILPSFLISLAYHLEDTSLLYPSADLILVKISSILLNTKILFC